MCIHVPGNQFDGALEEVFDVCTSGKKRSKLTNITKQVEMISVDSVHFAAEI